MIDMFRQGGLIMYPLLAATVAVLGYGVAAVRGVRTATGSDPRLEATIDGVLFWGGFSVVLGLIGTLVGVVQAAQAIELAGGAEPLLVWGGIRVALSSTILAMLVFGVASIVWFALRRAYARRRA